MNSNDIEIYFQLKDITVQSITAERKEEIRIEIKGTMDIDSIYSRFDVARLTRPWLLIIHGILSLFLDYPVTVYDITESGNHVDNSCTKDDDNPEDKNKTNKTTFKVGKNDYSSDLNKVTSKIYDSKDSKLAISLLDRWRKNLSLENEDMDGHLYRDEVLLGLFQILELLSNNYAFELQEKAKQKIQEDLEEYASLMLIRDSEIKNFADQNLKLISKVLDSDNLSFATKIKYLLSKNGITSENEMYFAESIVKIRNGIAHGRILFQPVFRWPVTPFFNISNKFTEIDMLRYLLKKLIGNFFEISTWDSEYLEIAEHYLKPPVATISVFLNMPEKFKGLDSSTLESSKGNKWGITWKNIFISYLENPKKLRLNNLANSLKSFFFNLEKSEENIDDIFNISVIFMESSNPEIVDQCKENIDWLLHSGSINDSLLLDIIPDLDFYSICYKEYKAFIGKKINRS